MTAPLRNLSWQAADMAYRIARHQRRQRRRRAARFATALIVALVAAVVLHAAPAKIAATVHQAEERAAW